MENSNSFSTDELYNINYYKSLKGEKALAERKMGRLPIIEIKGHPFFVQVRRGFIYPKDDFSTLGINLFDLIADRRTKELYFYYHEPTKSRVIIPENITEYPKDVVMVKIPSMDSLDPYGRAIFFNREIDYYMNRFPLIMYREAKIIPLYKTELAAIIKMNRAKLSTNKVVTAQRKQTKQKKGGIGL